MGRNFVAASSQVLTVASTPVTAVPMTMACWAQTDVNEANSIMFSIGNGANNDRWVMEHYANGLYISARQGGTLGEAGPVAGITALTWFHAAAVFTSTTSRTPYLNGTAGTANTTSVTPAAADRISVGRLEGITPSTYWGGLIAEAGIWNTALSAAQILLLAQGMSPTAVAPTSLVFYAPVYGAASPEPDLTAGARNLTVTGATAAAHPFIRIPRPPMAPLIPA